MYRETQNPGEILALVQTEAMRGGEARSKRRTRSLPPKEAEVKLEEPKPAAEAVKYATECSSDYGGSENMEEILTMLEQDAEELEAVQVPKPNIYLSIYIYQSFGAARFPAAPASAPAPTLQK